MPIKKKWILIVVIAVAIVVIGSLVPFFFGWFTPQPKVTAVRVGWLTGDLHDLAYFVAKNGTAGGGKSFFEKYNINVTDSNPLGYPNGPAEMNAFAAGDVDIGLLGVIPAITMHLNAGVNVIIIGEVNSDGSALVTKYPITSLNQLKGKTIATPGPGTVQYFLFLRLAEEEGIGVGNFTLVKLAPKDMQTSMAAGAIDAFIAWEPYSSDAVVNNLGVIYKNSSDIWPDHICCVVAVSKTFATNHPDIVINFLKAHIDATTWINAAKTSGQGSTNYDLLLDIGASFTGRSHAVIERALSNVNYQFDINESFMGCFIEFTYKLIQYNIVSSGIVQNRGYRDALDFADKFVNVSYLTKAMQT